MDMQRSSLFLALLFLLFHAKAQNVTVSGALVGNGSYATLTDAFAAINGGGQTGANITVSVLNDTWEGSGTALLNAGTWTSITVVPVGQPRTIVGATTAGQPMIELDGADRVVFSGLLGGQKGLTLYNSTNASTAGTSTVRLRNAATYNRFLHCRILGASQTFTYQEGGNFVFGSATQSGNNFNSIRDCELGPGGSDLPTKLVMCKGANEPYRANKQDSLYNNDFVDCFGIATSSVTVLLQTGASGWLVHGNRFYQTDPRTKQAMAGNHIDISNSVLTDTNYFSNVFSNNLIGPTPPPLNGKSVYTFLNNSGTYTAIYMGNYDQHSSSNVLNNVIRDIQIIGGTGSGGDMFTGIHYPSSSGIISGNQIGSTTDSSSIVVEGNYSGSAAAVGIRGGYGPGQQYSNNQIGGISVTNVGAGSGVFIGIVGGHSLATIVISGNTIGFVDAPIRVRAPGSGNSLYGISMFEGDLDITGNTVAYMQTSVPATYTSVSYLTGSFSVAGISARTTGSSFGGITGNTVHSLRNTHPTARTSIVGIESRFFTNVSGNQVHSLSLSTSATDAPMIGMNFVEGDPFVSNNMVRLGYDSDGQSLTRGLQIMGMRSIYYFPKYDHNSVYIGGGGVADTANTYALYCLTTVGNRRFLNNILFNARSNGSGTGRHYAILSGGSGQAPFTHPLSNGNDLYVTGVGGVVGRYDGADRLTLQDWRLATGQDGLSISHDPNFINPTGNALTCDLHIGPVAPIEGIGVPGSSVTVDIDNQTRATLTPRDIGADAGNFTPLVVQFPVVVLLGNNVAISSGDASPSLLDGTDFGTVLLCGNNPIFRTFQLRNNGNANLVVSSLNVVGSAAFVAFPLGVTTIAPGQTVTFTMLFSPTAPGMYSGTVTLQSNDPLASTYTFAVSGVALADTTAPVAVCQPLTVAIGANGSAVVNANTLGNGSSDNCAISSYTATPSQFTCAQLGPQSVQLSVADAAGNTSTCTSTVNVIDALAPQAACQPASLVLDASGNAQLTAAAITSSATDNCGIDTMWAASTQFTCAQVGTNAVQLSVRDAAGNVGTCTATVTVTETQAPVALCQPATLQLDASGNAQLTAAAIDGGSTDNCAIATRTLSQVQFTCADVGQQPVVLSVADLSSNIATCSTLVTVQDLIAPALTCANLGITLPSGGTAVITPGMVGTATDACGIAYLQLSQSQFDCADAGTNVLTLATRDTHGNEDSCTVSITITASPLSASVSTPPSGVCGYTLACAGASDGVASASASGACAPYTYAWSNGQTGAGATGLGAGQHSVTVTSADGQQQVQTLTLTAPAPLMLSLAATPSCPGGSTGSATATAAGGQSCQPYTYLWSNGATTDSLSGLAPGTYHLTLTDAAGCTDTASVVIGSWPASSVAITQNQGTLVATPGFVAYQWQDANGALLGATAAQYTPTATGLYHVVVTDSNGCTWTSAGFPFTWVALAPALPGGLDITLYPNPNAGLFQVRLSGSIEGPVEVLVYDLRGRKVHAETLQVLDDGHAFDLSGLAVGSYVLTIRAAGGLPFRLRFARE